MQFVVTEVVIPKLGLPLLSSVTPVTNNGVILQRFEPGKLIFKKLPFIFQESQPLIVITK